MLNNQATTTAQLATGKARAWRLPIDAAQVTAALRRRMSSVRDWARGPILPFAALWEASLWTSRADPRDGCYDPDPFGTENSFLSDDWP